MSEIEEFRDDLREFSRRLFGRPGVVEVPDPTPGLTEEDSMREFSRQLFARAAED